jgi:hypothetical protein
MVKIRSRIGSRQRTNRKGRLETGPSATGIPSREIRRSIAVLKPRLSAQSPADHNAAP